MGSMSTDNFIQGVHHKIKRKKQQRVFLKTAAAVMLIAFVSIQSVKIFNPDIGETDWAESVEIQSVYEWELYTDVETDKAWEYLIEELSIDELFELLENFDDISLIESIQMEG